MVTGKLKPKLDEDKRWIGVYWRSTTHLLLTWFRLFIRFGLFFLLLLTQILNSFHQLKQSSLERHFHLLFLLLFFQVYT